jgi:hypothetical protein
MESKVGIVRGPRRPLGLKPWIGAMDAPAFGPLGCRPCDAANEGAPGQRCTFSIPPANILICRIVRERFARCSHGSAVRLTLYARRAKRTGRH